ncbi:MAG: DNA helicase RecQ, partial [Bacteroidota bacterium]
MNMDLARQALKTYFGYDSFRDMQTEIIQSVFDKQDTLVLMPTGGGKSICFQIPALTIPGLCVVVSPLIALMKDQVEGLLANGVPAAYLNSTQDSSTQRTLEHDLLAGKVKLLYVSPEKLLSDSFLYFLTKLEINLFAIDEAHCISTWGHDFRQEYAQMAILKTRFPKVPMIALTATADRVTRKDILEKLAIPQAKQFVASFDRPNLTLNVLPGQNRFKIIRDFIKQRPKQAGIVYCLSRKSTEDMAEKLRKAGIIAAAYHAGMTDKQRSRNQEAFVKDDVHVVCATIAFGMGIDKSNVRWVIHYNLPKNLESFYQQIGRAGRDGLKSETLLFYSYQDIRLLQGFFEESNQRELLEAKLDRMKQYAESVTCRREILLHYFNEDAPVKCGTCDNCQNPPEVFDGTIIAQKALSAVARTRERVASNLLIDILRGSRKQQLVQAGWDRIKTYGAGSDVSFFDWTQYILQLLNQGYLHIAFDEGSALKLTEKSRKVLFEKETV